MAKFNNISAINLNTENNTDEFFNNFFDQELLITVEADQAITAFFEQRTQNQTAAKMLAGGLVLTCTSRGLDPLSVLDKIKSLEQLEIDAYMALLFNLSRVGTSKLGVVVKPQISKYITRTVLS
jgi:hypothetical protein